MLPSQPNQALIDGLAVLQELAVSENPIGSREMGRILGIEPTRANRLLRTLSHLGMARQTSDRKYIPGPAMHILSAQSLFASGLLRSALPALEHLGRFELVVAFGVLWRDQVCYLYHAEPGMDAAMAVGRVGLYPASQSSIGEAILAQAEPDAVRALYEKAAPDGFASVDDFLTELATVRARGWAFVHVNETTSTLGVAAGAGSYSAIAVSGAIGRDQIDDLVTALNEAAAQIDGAAHGGAQSKLRQREVNL